VSYVVLARKWRPQTFDDLVGQGHVSRTLANAIAVNRVAHAFLFTGVRGVGKTTSARILAKALNCEQGPTASPCLACNACREIGEGSDLDVLEIDGATYNGVDKVRELQESLPYRPSRDRFKIVIVDEVHMLSQGAWNAFLKTLEEPPPHVKFIFATTEVHKVPVTILSRCQRYDFKLIGVNEIAARLRHVLDVEGVTADEEAIRIVAREAAGSMRDAMSLLDQVIAWAGADALTGEGVARVLGVAERSVLHRLSGALLDGQAAACLEVVGDLAEQGYSLTHVARDFLQHLRDLVATKVGGDPARLELADAELAEVRALAARAELDDLSRLYLGFSRAFDDIARNSEPRHALEMALVRLSRRPPLLALDELLSRLADLERRLSAEGATRPETPVPKDRAGLDPAGPPRPALPPRAPAPEPPPAVEARVSPPARIPMPEPDSPAGPLARWRNLLDRIGEEAPLVASVLEHGVLRTFEQGSIVVGYERDSFALAQVKGEILETASRLTTQILGVPTKVEVEATETAEKVQTIAAVRSAERHAELEATRRRIAEHPLVRAALECLEAELRDVRVLDTN